MIPSACALPGPADATKANIATTGIVGLSLARFFGAVTPGTAAPLWATSARNRWPGAGTPALRLLEAYRPRPRGTGGGAAPPAAQPGARPPRAPPVAGRSVAAALPA